MASNTEVVNMALSWLGEPGIQAFTDDNLAGRLASRTYNETRDAMLREFPWNFASKRTSIAASATPPAWGYSFAYPLPADFLRLREIVNPGREPYEIENGQIVTDLSAPLQIRYLARITVEDQMEPSFRTALAARLAMDWAEAFSQSSSLQQRMAALYREKLHSARVADGQEGDQKVLEATSWIESRF